MVKELGKYKIIEQLSKGSASNIYLAVQKNLNRRVVIKELLREFSLNKKVITRFEQEARIISSLRYDSIIHIYDFWKKGHSYYIVMEYVPGKTLKDILYEIGQFPIYIGLIIFYEIAKTLEYAHNKGIIHRDLKPANIIISEEGRLKLLDFGIAHVKEMDLTTPGMILGTYSYMSPEQAIGTNIDHRSDIFSLGIIMYEILTGEKPFKKDSEHEVTEKIISEKPVRPRKLNTSIPRRVSRTIMKCLKKKPKKRFQNMGYLKERLEKYVRKFPLDHQTVLKNFLENLGSLKDQKTVLVESGETGKEEQREKKEKKEKEKKKSKQQKKRKEAVAEALLIKRKLPIPKSYLIWGLLFIIVLEIEFILHHFGIPLRAQIDWLIGTCEKIFSFGKQ